MKTCDNCGEHVSQDFWRVFSYQGELHACPSCEKVRSRLAIRAAGKADEDVNATRARTRRP